MMAVAVLRRARPGEAAGARPPSDGAAETPMQQRAAAAVRPHLELASADDQGWRPFELRLEIEGGLHLQANPASLGFLVPTEVSVSGGELRELVYPPGVPLDTGFSAEPIEVYAGRVEIRGEVKGGSVMHLGYQACSATGCLPVVRVDLPLAAAR